MNTPILAKLAALAIALCIFVTPADARNHLRHGDYWSDSPGYGGSRYDEYSYPGIRWYGDGGYAYTPYDNFGEGYRDDYDCYVSTYYGDDGYRSRHHGKRYGHRHHHRRHGGHHSRHRDDDDE